MGASLDSIIQAAQQVHAALADAEARAKRFESENQEIRIALQEARSEWVAGREKLKRFESESRDVRDAYDVLRRQCEKIQRELSDRSSELAVTKAQAQERELRYQSEMKKLAQDLTVAQAEAKQGASAVSRLRHAETIAAQAKASEEEIKNQLRASHESIRLSANELHLSRESHRSIAVQHQSCGQEMERLRAKAQAAMAELERVRRELMTSQNEKRQIDQEIARVEASLKGRADTELAAEKQRLERQAHQQALITQKGEVERVRQELSRHYEQFLRQERTRWGQVVEARDQEIARIKNVVRSGAPLKI